MPIALSREDFAALAAKNPGLKPDALLKLASLHNDIRLGSLRDGVASAWDKANAPLDGNALTKAAQGVSPKLQADLNDSPTWAAIKGFGAGALEGAAGVADSFTSPMGLAGLLLGAGEGVAGAKGLAGLAKAAKAGNTALNVGNAAGAIAKASGPNAGMQDYLAAGLSTLPALAGKGGASIGAELASKRMASEVGAAGPGTPAKLAAEAARKAKKALQGLPEETVTRIQTVFAKNDSYGKPRAHIGAEKIQALLDDMGLPDEVYEAGLSLINKIGSKKIRPDQVAAVLTGEKYDPGRIIRIPKAVPEGEKQIPGAPLGTWNQKQVRRLREDYIKAAEEGADEREWYTNSGKAILHHAGDMPGRARKLAGATSVTSSGTSVDTNVGFAIKGHNQATAGMPIKTGRFPTAMGKAIEKVYATEDGDLAALGPKREPFAENLAHGGGFSEYPNRRLTHDIWDGEARGYVNHDGTPLRRGYTDAEHRYMDRDDDKIIPTMNARKVAGFDDWDQAKAQAATWRTAKIRAGDIAPDAPPEDVSNYFAPNYLQEGRDNMPGRNTRHLQGIHEDPAAMADLNDALNAILYDSKGREIAARDKGLLAGGSFEGPGYWVDEQGLNEYPGRQVQTAVGSRAVKGLDGTAAGRDLDPASRGLVEANAAQYGLSTGQAAVAGTKMDHTAPARMRDLVDVALGGPVTSEHPIMQTPSLRAHLMGEKVAAMPAPEGLRVANIGLDPEQFKALVKELQADTTGLTPKKREIVQGHNQGFYIPNAWDTPDGAVGQQYARVIRDSTPNGVELFNKTAPQQAGQLLDVYAKATQRGHPVNPVFMDMLAHVRDFGFDGITKVALKYGLPVPALLLMLQKAHTSAQEGKLTSFEQ